MDSKPIPPDFLQRMRNHPAMRSEKDHFGTTSANILTFGMSNLIPQLFSNCHRLSRITGSNLTRENWQCGEVSVQNLDNIQSGERTKEELEIVMTGQRKWVGDQRSQPLCSLRLHLGFRNAILWMV